MTDEAKLELLEKWESRAWDQLNNIPDDNDVACESWLDVIERCQHIRANLAPLHDPDYLKSHVKTMDEIPNSICTLKNCPYHYQEKV